MWKLISVVVAILFFAIFFIQNMTKVPVRFVISDPVDIRLTYLLLTSFIVGYLACMVLNVAKNVKKREQKFAYENETDLEEEEVE